MSIAEKLTAIAENEQRVFDAGHEKGTSDFWDILQQNGNRTSYLYGFADWGCEYIRPKYKVVPTVDYITGMFAFNSKLKKVEAQYFDLSQHVSSTVENNLLFRSCSALEEVEDIGMRAVRYYRTWHSCTSLHTIAVVRVNANTPIVEAFNNCTSLVNITLQGTLGQNGLDLHWSTKLSKTSIESVLAALSGDTTGLTVTLSQTAVDNAFETSEGAADGSTSDAWQTLLATKPNWTVALT